MIGVKFAFDMMGYGPSLIRLVIHNNNDLVILKVLLKQANQIFLERGITAAHGKNDCGLGLELPIDWPFSVDDANRKVLGCHGMQRRQDNQQSCSYPNGNQHARYLMGLLAGSCSFFVTIHQVVPEE